MIQSLVAMEENVQMLEMILSVNVLKDWKESVVEYKVLDLINPFKSVK